MLGPLLPVLYEVLEGQPSGQVLFSHMSSRESLPQAPEYISQPALNILESSRNKRLLSVTINYLGVTKENMASSHLHPFHGKLPHHLVHAFLMNKWVKVKYKNREIFKEAVYYLRCIGLIFRPATPTYFMATVNNHTTQLNPLLTSLWEKLSSSVSNHQQLTNFSSPSGPSCSWPTPTSLGPAFHSCQQPLALAGRGAVLR